MLRELMSAATVKPRVVIVGGGFGGLSAAFALAHAPVQVTLVDRTNHHVFQPLLYQVAIAMLSPGDVAAPIRQIVARQRNTEVLMAEVTDGDPDERRVCLAGELRRFTLPKEFRHFDPRAARVVLLDAGDRVLATFDPELSRRVHARLERMGIEVRLGYRVDHVDADGVIANGERIESRTVVWTA